jgi:hypothetical protein
MQAIYKVYLKFKDLCTHPPAHIIIGVCVHYFVLPYNVGVPIKDKGGACNSQGLSLEELSRRNK